MTQYLPPNLLALFAPRDPLPFLPPPDKLPHEKKTRGYLGVGSFLAAFEVSNWFHRAFVPSSRRRLLTFRRFHRIQKTHHRRHVLRRVKSVWSAAVKRRLNRLHTNWSGKSPCGIQVNSKQQPKIHSKRCSLPVWWVFHAQALLSFGRNFIDFISFVQNYDTSESKLRREFEVYGPIKKIVVVQNIDTSKPRGYAFIEYEHERDMHCKYFMCCSVEWQPDIHHITSPKKEKTKISEQNVCSKQMRLSPLIHSSLINTFCVKSRK